MEMVNMIVLLLLLSSSLVISSSPSPLPDVRRVCDLTPANEAPYCNSFISNIVKNGKTGTDPPSILLACINRCIVDISAAIKKAPPLVNSVCLELIPQSLNEALVGFKNKDIEFIQTRLQASYQDIGLLCLDEVEGRVDPATMKLLKTLYKKLSTCSNIAHRAKILLGFH